MADTTRSAREDARRIVAAVLAEREGHSATTAPPPAAAASDPTASEPAARILAPETATSGDPDDPRARARALVAEVLAARAAGGSPTVLPAAPPADAADVPADPRGDVREPHPLAEELAAVDEVIDEVAEEVADEATDAFAALAATEDAPVGSEAPVTEETPTTAAHDLARARARELVVAALADAQARTEQVERQAQEDTDARERAEAAAAAAAAERLRREDERAHDAERREVAPLAGDPDVAEPDAADPPAAGVTTDDPAAPTVALPVVDGEPAGGPLVEPTTELPTEAVRHAPGRHDPTVPMSIAELAAAGIRDTSPRDAEVDTRALPREDDAPAAAPRATAAPLAAPERDDAWPSAADGAAPAGAESRDEVEIAADTASRRSGDPLEATVEPREEPESPRRTGRWLLTSLLGAVALAVLFPLAVDALRTLVSL